MFQVFGTYARFFRLAFDKLTFMMFLKKYDLRRAKSATNVRVLTHFYRFEHFKNSLTEISVKLNHREPTHSSCFQCNCVIKYPSLEELKHGPEIYYFTAPFFYNCWNSTETNKNLLFCPNKIFLSMSLPGDVNDQYLWYIWWGSFLMYL